MTSALALVAGYLLGGVPTTDWLATRRGVDLRGRGSGNPGANNALRLGGRGLAATVLAVEIVKGIVCVGVGASVGGEGGMAVAGVGAALGMCSTPTGRFGVDRASVSRRVFCSRRSPSGQRWGSWPSLSSFGSPVGLHLRPSQPSA